MKKVFIITEPGKITIDISGEDSRIITSKISKTIHKDMQSRGFRNTGSAGNFRNGFHETSTRFEMQEPINENT